MTEPQTQSADSNWAEFYEDITEQADDLAHIQDHITKVIGSLDIDEALFSNYDEPNRANYDLIPMVKLFIYQHTMGFGQMELERRTHGLSYMNVRFGFDGGLSQQLISHNWRNRFNPDERVAIKETADIVREIGEAADILDEKNVGLDPDEVTTSQGIGESQIMEAVEKATDLGFAEFTADRADNAKYPLEAYFERQGYLNMADAGTTTKTRRFARLSKRDEVPTGSAHNRTMKLVADPSQQLTFEGFQAGEWKPKPKWKRIRDEILPAFHQGVENILDILTDGDDKSVREPVNVALDIVKWPFWASPYRNEDEPRPGDQPVTVRHRTRANEQRLLKADFPEMVAGYKENEEYMRGFKFATLTIVANDTPIVLAIEPVRDSRKWEPEDLDLRNRGELVGALLDQATQHVEINKVYADREFDTFQTFVEIDRRDLYYVIPKKTQANEDKIAVENTVDHDTSDVSVEHATLHHDGHEQDVSIMYVPSKSKSEGEYTKGDYAVFTANYHVSPDQAMGIVRLYRDRWMIENEYKTIKANFLPKSATKDYRTRFLYFVIGVIMYNVWRLSNIFLRDMVDVHLGEDPPILAGEIVEIVGIALFDPGG